MLRTGVLKTLTSAQVRFDMFRDGSHDTCDRMFGDEKVCLDTVYGGIERK
jgi:hypothetical protein